jgi:hypothetical protein
VGQGIEATGMDMEAISRGIDYGRGHHGHRGPRVFISPRLVAPFGPSWEPDGDPPVVVAPPPRWQVRLRASLAVSGSSACAFPAK